MAKGKYEYWLTEDGQALTKDEMINELKAPVISECIGNEKDFEQNILENIDLICDCLGLSKIKDIQCQRMINEGDFSIKPDIMVYHWDGTITIFEVKKASKRYPSTGTFNQMGAIGQLLLYQNVLEALTDKHIRLALIDNKIYWRTYCAFADQKLPITLLDFQCDRLFVPYNAWI